MPAYNVEKYIQKAIQSVIDQTHSNWELIIINDGSTDNTLAKIKLFEDDRIAVFDSVNKGVSAARNIGLSIMTGEYFCFLDSDDYFSKKSLECRVNLIVKSDVSFVDGAVSYVNVNGESLKHHFVPSFKGNPFNKLISLSSACFFGNTWMVKRCFDHDYKFDESVKYSEDLLFYLDIARTGIYDYTNETILYYRQHSKSSTADIESLVSNYSILYRKMIEKYSLTRRQKLTVLFKVKKISFLSLLFDANKPVKAIKSLFFL